MSSTYSFADCLRNSHAVNWRIDDVLGDRVLDRNLRWLPGALSGAGRLDDLTEEEARALTQVEMASYAHLFGYVEAFIAPKVVELADGRRDDDRDAFDALTNFAAEEVKHMTLFREVRRCVDGSLGFRTRLLDGAEETARFVLTKSTGAVLLLTAVIEWFTQRHYIEAMRDDDGLDPLTRRVFHAHWLEESQHARMDHLEAQREFAGMSDGERDRAIDDLIELVGALDGLLRTQVDLDMENLETRLGRGFDMARRDAIHAAVLAAKRWTFIESGVTHPRFVELFTEVATPDQQARVMAALEGILSPVGAR